MSLNLTTFVTYGVLGLACATSFMLPSTLSPSGATASSMASDDQITIMGVVRDFASSHADFNKTPVGGLGHSAGNIAWGLHADTRPEFSGGGRKVATQWRDKNNKPIPPHLASTALGAPGKIHVNLASPNAKHGVLDTYNSAAGPYGGANKGGPPSYVIGTPMPNISPPTTLTSLPNQGALTYSGTSTISANIRCDTFSGSGTITINGNVSILCEQNFSLATHAKIVLGANARLTLWLLKGGSSWNHVELNKNTANPSRVVVYNLGTGLFMIHNHADVHATIIAPNGALEISNHGELFGRFFGKQIQYDNHGDFHVDGAPRLDFCGITLNDVAGTSGVATSGAISSAATFAQWFTDTLGVNLSTDHPITLTRDAAGVYEYLDNDFHPIDNMLLGNEGAAHNHFFTYTLNAPFTHRACDGRFIEFEGADDFWLFIDGMLAMDLGGVQPGTPQRLDLARLNLVDGQQYRLHIFYAQRNPNSTIFRLRTNLELIEEYVAPTITAVGD